MLNIGPKQRLFLRFASSLMVFLVVTANLQAQDKSVAAPGKPVAVTSETVFAQDKPVVAPSKPPVQTTEPLAMTARQTLTVNEIAALQARMGSGVAESLQGVVAGSDPHQFFQDSLKKLVAQEKMATITLLPASPAGPNRDSQAALRASARKLEGLAAELEQVQLYDKADELRGIASKYWLQARSMN